MARRPQPWLPFRRGPSLLDPVGIPSPVDVLRVPFAYSQGALLSPSGFRRAAADRGVRLDRKQLELLHRRGLLVPLLQVHAQPVSEPVLDLPEPASPWGRASVLRAAAMEGRLTDPTTRPFRPWPRRDEPAGLLYSTYQLLGLRSVAWTMTAAKARRAENGDIRWDIGRPDPTHRYDVARTRALAVALEVLAPRYRPRIMRVIYDPSPKLNDYLNDRDPAPELALLGCSPDALVRQAEHLLIDASFFDPLGQWQRVVRIGDPGKWEKLRFDALLAVEHRVAAEMLLHCYEDLADHGQAAPLPDIPGRSWTPRHDRISVTARERADTLLDFRLADGPAVYLALEGDTELCLAPKILAMHGLGDDSDLVRLVNLRSVDRDVRLLAGTVAVPRLDPTGPGPARVLSQLVGLIVAVDPEKKYATPLQERQQRDGMITEVLESLPQALRTATMRANLEHLIRVRTWGTNSFEFAHFTDRELARALRRLAGRDAPTVTAIQAQVAACRSARGNIEKMWKPWAPRLGKTQLAEALWPTLDRKITPSTPLPPIADVIDEAVHLAYELRPVRGMAIEPDPTS